MIQENTLPEFYYYEKDKKYATDNGYETLQDFNLSWLFKCAEDKFKDVNQKLNEYAKLTVFLLIYGSNNEAGEYTLDIEMNNAFKVVKVETRRQWNRIDLIADVEIENKSVPEKYVLNIENKSYTKIRNGQLENYRKHIETEYGGKRKIVNLCIFCDSELIDESQKKICKDNQYKILTIPNIKDLAKMYTETNNALFDEYWFRYY